MNFHDLLPIRKHATPILACVLPWWGSGSHRNIGYNSNDPAVISRQLALMQQVGIDGVVLDWYGASSTFSLLHTACALMSKLAASYGMLTCIMLDSGMVKWRPDKSITPTQEVINQISNNTGLFTSSSYLPERYVLEFGMETVAADLQAIQNKLSALNGMVLLKRHVGYTWPETTNTLGQLKSEQAKTTVRMASAFAGFDDRNPADPVHSVWDSTKPARVVDGNRGNLLLDSFALLPNWADYLQLVTWNDYEEGTALEDFCTKATGFKIA